MSTTPPSAKRVLCFPARAAHGPRALHDKCKKTTTKSSKMQKKKVFLTFQKNVISEPPRPQIELRIAVVHSSRCRRSVWITLERFRKNHFSTKNLHFARVTFQFSAHEQNIRRVFADIKAFSNRSRKYLVWPRAVLAAVPEKPLKNRLEGLNLPLAVGPSFFHDRPTGGECFAPLVAQAAQVASGQPERVRTKHSPVRLLAVFRYASCISQVGGVLFFWRMCFEVADVCFVQHVAFF